MKYLVVLFFSFSLIIGGSSAVAKVIDCNDEMVPEAMTSLSDISLKLESLDEDAARKDSRITHPSNEKYTLDLSKMDGTFDENVAHIYDKVDEMIDKINNPQTAEEKKSADGFSAKHVKNRMFENSGHIDIKKPYPFVGPQGIKIKYSVDKETQIMELTIEKTAHAKWEKDVEPKVYDFLGQLL